jgi:predicted MFS family arabinose efflux permease
MLKGLTKEEKRVIFGISFAVAVRMLGLFLLLPVLSPYLKTLDGATPLALGFMLSLLKNSFVALVLLVFFFLVGFHLLEPIIPSLLTRLTHRDIRGLSLGFFNTTQFVGAFLGGLWGGFVLKHGLIYMTVLGFLFSLLWFFGAYLWFKRL